MTESIRKHTANTFKALFTEYEGPPFAIRLWDGWQWKSSANLEPACTLAVGNPRALRAFVTDPSELTMGKSFINGDVDVEGDFFEIFSIVEQILNRPRRLRQQLEEQLAGAMVGLGRLLRHGRLNSLHRSQASIAHHYDHPADFFEPWLGKSMVYSCGYFRNAQDSLDAAQEQKLELICDKLRLRPEERFLDIGCGWGSLLLHAAGKRLAHAEGITLSREQASTAKRRIEKAGLEHICQADLCDYRAIDGSREPFDKIASVGMFEHVGLKNLPHYFGIAYRLLKPGGLFLNHGIARAHGSSVRQSSFIDRFVFPDGRLVTLAEALHAAESQGLEVRDVENLREHYELTLRRWVEGLRKNSTTLLEHVPEITYRSWLLYMAGCAAAFRRGDIGIYQVLLSRPDHGNSRLPLTRDDLYTESRSRREEALV